LEECLKKAGAASPVGSGPCENPTKRFAGWVSDKWRSLVNPAMLSTYG